MGERTNFVNEVACLSLLTRCQRVRQACVPLVMTVFLALGSGCYYVPRPTHLPALIREISEPEFGGVYSLYVPSFYEKEHPLPLVITCHGTEPWDTREYQINRWAEVAESKRFIVAAPQLKGAHGDFLWSINEQISRQNEDERHILATVRHIQAGYSVMKDRIFLTGWSAGSYAVLHTGLRNPNVFRALAVRQGNFDERLLVQTLPFLDRYQPIYVFFGVTDVLVTDQPKKCIEWLRDKRMYVFEERIPGTHQRGAEQAYRFFRTVIKREPLLQVQAFDADEKNPLAIAFKMNASPEPIAYLWQFGDEAISRDRDPTHVYKKESEYDVQLTVRYKNKKQRIRRFSLQVPRVRIGAMPSRVVPATQPATNPTSQPTQ